MNHPKHFPDLYLRIFTINDIAEETQLPISTLRTWVTRNIVAPSTSYNPGSTAGRGTKALYSVFDAMQFLLVAEITKKTLSVKEISECCMSQLLDLALDRLSDIADGVYHGNNCDPSDQATALERYAFIFETEGEISCTQDWEWRRTYRNSLWIIFDAIDFAHRIYTMYLRKKGVLSV